jgi:hypothetical protein
MGPGALAFALLATPAFALDLRVGHGSRATIGVPDEWALLADGPWSMAEAPDHRARLRVAPSTAGLPGDPRAEAHVVDLIADTWNTYIIDRRARRVVCGRWVGIEVVGHGAGDGWDRAFFHIYLLAEQTSQDKGVVVLLTGRSDAWPSVHPALDRAVHGMHPG